jgi:hypothetical protein
MARTHTILVNYGVSPLTLSQSRMRGGILYADGGTLGGSPGQGVYWSVGDEQGAALHRDQDTTGKRRWSDEAEYLALEAALRIILRQAVDGDEWVVLMDCRGVLRQVRNERTPRRPRTRDLYWTCQELLLRLTDLGVKIHLKWVARGEVVKVLGH